jgi:DNA-binding NtrC family response regulator
MEKPLGAIHFSLASDIVELVILTADDAFLRALRDAVGPSRRLWHVPTADKVSDLLVAGQVGILILDVTALHEPAGGFLSQIKRQFPDLVVVVAGDRETERSLSGLISTGAVYRFIHKPMSPDRAKLFADAAVKKYSEQRRRLATAPAAVVAPQGRRWLWLMGSLVLATLVIGTWFHNHASTG